MTVRLSAVVAILLSVRFFSGVTLQAVNPPTEVARAAGGFLDAYGVVLPLVLLGLVVLLSWPFRGPPANPWRIPVLIVHLATLVAWLASLATPPSSLASLLFPPLAIAAVASASLLSLMFAPPIRTLAARWWGPSYLALLGIVPVAFAMRVVVPLGIGTSADPVGVLHGDWLLTYLPTLLLELLAIGTWLLLVSGLSAADLRRRWPGLLPFAVVPLVAALFAARPLAGFIFSATVSWGANLALFRPVTVSFDLALIAVAGYASTLILLRSRGAGAPWALLGLGSTCVVLAGFFPAMASVEGLTFGLLLTGLALSRWS